jgi:hypothetical protein
MAKEIGQVFGGIGDAVSGVLKGVGDAVNGAVKGVGTLAKQIWDSDVGKAIIIAGAIYFGGAALAGGYGSAGVPGGSFFSGMGTGVSSAATSLEAAWNATTWSEAGSAIGNSWGAAADAGANAARYTAQFGSSLASNASTLMDAGGDLSGVAEKSATYSGGSGGPDILAAPGTSPMAGGYPSATLPTAQAPVVAAVPAAPSSSIGLNTAYTAPTTYSSGSLSPYSLTNTSSNLLSATGSNLPTSLSVPAASAPTSMLGKLVASPYTAPALISGAMQVGGALVSGAGQKQAQEDQQEYERRMMQEQIDRRNANMAGVLWSPSPYTAVAAPVVAASPARRYMPQSTVPGSQFAQAYNNLPPGQGLVRSVMG